MQELGAISVFGVLFVAFFIVVSCVCILIVSLCLCFGRQLQSYGIEVPSALRFDGPVSVGRWWVATVDSERTVSRSKLMSMALTILSGALLIGVWAAVRSNTQSLELATIGLPSFSMTLGRITVTSSTSVVVPSTSMVVPSTSMVVSTASANTIKTTVASTTTSTTTTSFCKHVFFLRIQKTGSSTLGELLMPKLCNKTGQTCKGLYHLDYYRAQEPGGGGCMVTMLRDPVERLISELSMTLGPEGWLQNQDQWDWEAENLPTLHKVQECPVGLLNLEGQQSCGDIAARFSGVNFTKKVYEYLHARGNPTLNRQTLYVHGFDRVPCGPDRKKFVGGNCCGICSQKHALGRKYVRDFDWEKDHRSILAVAKQNLLGMRFFGIADCFTESLAEMANILGWDKERAMRLAQSSHKRQQVHRLVPAEVQEEIRKLNFVDEELVDFARTTFFERYGHRCTHKRRLYFAV